MHVPYLAAVLRQRTIEIQLGTHTSLIRRHSQTLSCKRSALLSAVFGDSFRFDIAKPSYLPFIQSALCTGAIVHGKREVL